ncbi:uncharacterized protein LOC144927471 isoform X1 [Branchiostoma floridae x Branchiostoma belcheri]
MGSGGSKKKQDSNHLIKSCADHSGGVNCLSLSRDGSLLITGSEDRTARLWSTRTHECVGVLTGHADYITSVSFVDNYAVTSSADKTIRKWDLNSCDCVLVFTGHSSPVNRVTAAGGLLFTSSYDRTARCWQFDSGECVQVFLGHKRGITPILFVAPDGDNSPKAQHDTVDASKDLVITGSLDSTAKAWSLNGKCKTTFKGHKMAILSMAVDRQGKTLFTGSHDANVMAWTIDTGEALRTFEGHQGGIICIEISNKLMYTGSSDHTAKCWVVDFGDRTREYKGQKHTVSCMTFHEGVLFTGSGDACARAFDAKSGALKRTYRGHEYIINAVAVVDGKLFTASHDGTLKVWNAENLVAEDWGKPKKDEEDKENAKRRNSNIDQQSYRSRPSTGLSEYDKRSREKIEQERKEREVMDMV